MFLLILLWGLHEKESEEPITIAFWMNMICIFLDVISIGVHFPTSSGDEFYGYTMETTLITFTVSFSASTSKRFSAGMAIVNLLLRPISSFFLYHILQDRGVQFKDPSEFTHEVDAFESVSSPKSRSPYQDIDKVGHPQISQPIPVAELDSDHHWTEEMRVY